MERVRLHPDDRPEKDELAALYDAVGWTAYTRDPESLMTAIANSTFVVTARDERGSLIGLARGLSDDVSVFYLQDILVRPERQRQGVGRSLLHACLQRFAHVRQKILLTDDDPGQLAFYESFGYRVAGGDADPHLAAFVRLDG
jgi:GNAT superfamily N-acetyltransferase